MSDFKMDFVGFDELVLEFEQMADEELKELEKEALQNSAEIVKKQQVANWNRSNLNDEHIEDNIKIGRVYDVATGSKIVIAPKHSLRWRGKFVEWGTSYQAPQAPVQKSLDQTENQVAKIMMDTMEKVIK